MPRGKGTLPPYFGKAIREFPGDSPRAFLVEVEVIIEDVGGGRQMRCQITDR